jgi:3-carboxy-cis,cis-muconate cycloisomerase
VLAGALAADGHDDQLRAALWAAFDFGGDLGQADAGIDRILARQRALTVQTEGTVAP